MSPTKHAQFAQFFTKPPLLGAALLLALAGCSSINSTLGGSSEQEALGKVVWNYAENAITLNTVADPRLNEHEAQAHTLVLAVVQMADPNAFTALLADTGAVAKLLETGKPVAGLLAVDRFIVKPGVRATNKLGRAQFAQYFGIIPGYFQIDPKINARLFPIGVRVESTGLMVKTRTAAPAPLAVRVDLGPFQVAGAQQVNVEATLVAADPARARAAQSGQLNVDAGSVLDAARSAQSARQLTR